MPGNEIGQPAVRLWLAVDCMEGLAVYFKSGSTTTRGAKQADNPHRW
jgi:hypothetical protein